VALAEQLGDERLRRLPGLGDLDPQLALRRMHATSAKAVAITIAIVAQAALPLRPALIPGAAKPRVELLLNRPLDDQLRAEPRQLGQHLLRILDQLAR
jgi:hypothetical protein